MRYFKKRRKMLEKFKDFLNSKRWIDVNQFANMPIVTNVRYVKWKLTNII